MKKFLVILMILVLAMTIAGCKKEAAPQQQPQPGAPAPGEQPAAPVEQPAAPAEGAAPAAEGEGVVEVPETEMGPGIVSDEAIETGDYTQHSLLGAPQNADPEHARDLTMAPERFSNFDCVKDEETGIRYISIKVTNTNADRSFMISPVGVSKGYDTYFNVRGLVDKDPGCAVEELMAGESTVCDRIGLDDERYGNPEGTNRLSIQSPDNDGKVKAEAVIVNCPA